MRDDYLRARGIPIELADRMGIGWDEHRNALVIPYFDGVGNLVATRWRMVNGDHRGRYLSPPGGGVHLYNIAATEHSPVWIAEGEIDCLSLLAMGLDACAVPGATAWRTEWRWLFVESDVRIVFDADEAGLRGARRVAQDLRHVASEVTIVELPDGTDVNDLWVRDREALERALGLMDL